MCQCDENCFVKKKVIQFRWYNCWRLSQTGRVFLKHCRLKGFKQNLHSVSFSEQLFWTSVLMETLLIPLEPFNAIFSLWRFHWMLSIFWKKIYWCWHRETLVDLMSRTLSLSTFIFFLGSHGKAKGNSFCRSFF